MGGDVALDDPELADKIEMLRKTAADLSPPGGFTTKLIIPPESQILFTTLTAPGPPDDITREVQIRAGLEGLTPPYEVGELVFDWQADGDAVHVAVLARETLAEAEAFASEHRMNPVSYVARGKPGTFKGEAFFGRTGAAATLLGPAQQVERDKKDVPPMSGTAAGGDATPATDPPVSEDTQPEAALAEPVRLEDPIMDEAPPIPPEPEVDLAPPFPDFPTEGTDPAFDPAPPEGAPDPPEPAPPEPAPPEPDPVSDLALDPFMQVEDPARAADGEESFEDRLAGVPDPASKTDEAEDALLAPPFPPTPPSEGDDQPSLPPITPPVIRDMPEDEAAAPPPKPAKERAKRNLPQGNRPASA